MRQMAQLVVCVAVLWGGCRDHGSGFQRAFGVSAPEGSFVENEYYFARWDSRGFSYYCVLHGGRPVLGQLVRMFNLRPSQGVPQVGFPALKLDKYPWWTPPSIADASASADNYCRVVTEGPMRIGIVAQLSGTRVFLHKRVQWIGQNSGHWVSPTTF